MKIILFFLIFSSQVFADQSQTRHYESGEYQTHLLELYTSEGCSSCPPAEAWLRKVKPATFDQLSIIPLAFHVTYWDYIGWKDVFSKKQYDQRQRKMVLQEGGNTVYTPQFFIDSTTKRGITSAIHNIDRDGQQRSKVKIKVSLNKSPETLKLAISLKRLRNELDSVVRVNVVTYENGIKSTINAGENEGRQGQHEYVAREMKTALMSLDDEKSREFKFNKVSNNWSGVVVFIESGNKVIEALNVPL